MVSQLAASAAPRFGVGSDRFMVACFFVGSGAAALIYEVVWLQLLQLVIGLTSVSLGLLLGTFMGGMCLGSLLVPRWVSPGHHPLKVYAALEIGIAVSGVALLFFLPWITGLYTSIGGAGASGLLLRASVAAACLLVPSFLMGATLPAVARWVESTRDGVSWLGVFYAGNILGGVAGCLIAGFYLLRVHDTAIATYVAAALNGLVALAALAWAASHSGKKTNEGCATTVDAELDPVEPGNRNKVYAVLICSGVSGATALGEEVVWTRLLSLLLGGTVYTFSIILAVFLSGLGIGSTLGSWWARTLRRPHVALWGCQLLLTAGMAWTAAVIARSLPYWPINPTLSLNPWHSFQLDVVRCIWAVLPPAVLWGASFPLAVATLSQWGAGRAVGNGFSKEAGSAAAQWVSRLYAANTLGALLGSLVFSLGLTPRFGTHVSQCVLIGLAGLSAAWIALAFKKGADEEKDAEACGSSFVGLGWGAAAAAVAMAGLFIFTVVTAPWGLAAYGRFMATYGKRLVPEIVKESDLPAAGGDGADIFCLYQGEGLNGTVAVTQWSSGVRNFHSAGKVQASNDPRDMRLQRMLGHLSALMHEKPESALVVACGAGVTAGAFVPHPDMKRIVICDIEPLVPRVVAPMFEGENHGVLKDARTQVFLDDGRHFVRTTKEKFDIITSDPIDPWVKGCAALNTVEYFEMCKARLKPGGVMSLWIPLYESDLVTVKSSISTFFKVFPHGVIWANDTEEGGYDAVLLGTAEPMKIDVGALRSRLDRPDHAAVKASLAEGGFPSVIHLLGTYAGRASDLGERMKDAEINTDRNLRLQYLAGWSFNHFVGARIMNDMTRHRKFPRELFVGSESELRVLKSLFPSAVAEP
ncbi:MAG: SAM-dependent methyltransferase [Verrucomicrobia bacterium]|nr:SAM-dependent methyltransferase [Verrucomicrobiota bacterium]